MAARAAAALCSRYLQILSAAVQHLSLARTNASMINGLKVSHLISLLSHQGQWVNRLQHGSIQDDLCAAFWSAKNAMTVAAMTSAIVKLRTRRQTTRLEMFCGPAGLSTDISPRAQHPKSQSEASDLPSLRPVTEQAMMEHPSSSWNYLFCEYAGCEGTCGSIETF